MKVSIQDCMRNPVIDCNEIGETPKVYQVVRNGEILATFSKKYTAELYMSDCFLNCEEDCKKDEFEIVEHEIKNSIL